MANFFSQLIGRGGGSGNRTLNYYNAAFQNLGSNAPVTYQGNHVYDYSQALNGVQFDQFGYTNQLPGDLIAPEVQLRANQIASQRNDRLLTEGTANAAQALQSGLGNLQSYRPGSAAALMSPYYQSLANTYFQGAVARQQDAPDLMFRYDERMQKRAAAQAKQAGLVSGIGSLAAVIAAPFTGGASLAALPFLNNKPSTPGGPGTHTFPGGSGASVPGGTLGSGTVPGMTPLASGGQGAPMVPGGGGTAQGMPAGSGQDFTGSPGGGQKTVAPGAPGVGGAAGSGGGGSIQSGGSGGGGGGGKQGAAGGGGTGVSAASSAGPATTALAAMSGAGAQTPLYAALLRRVFSTQPNLAHEFAARLNLIMARDTPLMSA